MKTRRCLTSLMLTAAILSIGFFFLRTSLNAWEMDPVEEINEQSPITSWQPVAMHLNMENDHIQRFPTAPRMIEYPTLNSDQGSNKGWQEIVREDFEVLFPQSNGWQTFNSLGYAPYYWGKSNYLAHGGTYSGWCAGAHRTGNPDLNPATNPYPNNMKGWMIWGPFDLSDADDAELLFFYWLESEEGYDLLAIMASVDGSTFYGVSTSGNSGGWVGQEEFDLTAVYTLGDLTGQPHVWIAFIFTSDTNNNATGAFLDDIVLRKEVINAPPVIMHTPVASATAGQNATIAAIITDDVGVTNALLLYRRGGDETYSTVVMTAVETVFSGTIPGASVTSRGLEYYLSATDGNSTSFSPANNPQSAPHVVRIQTENLMKAAPQPGGSEQTAYRLFSVPIELDDGGVEAVLADDLGGYDDSQWRFFRYEDDVYDEHPNAGDIEPGKAFWLIVREADKNIDAGSGTSVSTADSFAITLHPGWNDVGLPFDFPVSWNRVRVDTTAIDGPYAYVDQWILPQLITYLAPWSGYAFYNLTGSDVIMKIPPIFGMGTAKETTSHDPFAARVDIPWYIQLRAGCSGARDEINYLGCSSQASRERDALDLSEPPPVGAFVSLYFPHTEWAPGKDRLTVDFRPPADGGEKWDLSIVSNQPGSWVQLSWEINGSVPLSRNVTLIDVSAGEIVDMKAQNRYSFLYHKERSFQVVMGPAKAAQGDQRSLPSTWRLYQNHPNPFNPLTRIEFDLMRDAYVKLVIYNVRGEQVKVLCCQQRCAGHHQVELDARDLASGIYFCHLWVDGFSDTKKMVLMK